MPVDVLPETSPVVVDVQTEAAGLSAPEVESLVTVPLEKNLLEGVLGVTDVTSDSVPGLSAIELHFAPGTDLLHARQLVQERLTGAFVLPNVSKPPVMLQPVSSTSDVMLVGLTSRTLSMTDMSVLARWTIVPRLLGLPGVANVSTFGQADRQLQVLLDPATLAAHDVTLGQIVETAGNAQLVSPLSFLEASTPGTGGFLEGPDQRITIQPVLPFGTPSNMAQLPVAGAASGLRLGDVATVVQGNPPLIGDGAVNGGAGLVLVVQKLPSANVLAVTREVDQALAGMRPGLPGLVISPSLFREDTYLRNSLNNLWVALIEAGALAALALIALLMRLRLAFAALFGVALSLIAATAVLSLLGYTFNALVTLGLLVALGFVVTEAAGEAQAIAARLDAVRADGRNDGRGARRRRADGVRAAGAARLVAAACGDLRGALCAASVAVVACVVPLLVATGLTASFLRPAALAFALAVVASMVVAVTVTPAIATAALAIAPSRPRVTVFGDRAGAGYARALGALARAPRRALTITAAAAAVGVAALVLLPWVHPGQPVFADRELVVRLTGPPGMSLTEMSRMTVLAARELRALPSVQEVGATDGRAVTSDQVVNTNTGELWVTLRPSANYAGAVTAVRAIASGTPGIAGTVSTYESDAMTGVLSGAPAQVVARIYGLDYRELARLAGQLRTEVAGIGGVTGTSVQLPVSQPTVDVTVNLDAAARAGISPGDVRREAGTLLSGLTVGNYFENQEVFDVVVWGTPAVRNSLSSIGNLELDSPNGGHVRLGQVASIAVRPEPADIPQEAMARYADVTASVTGSGGSAGAISDAIAGKLAALRYPAEYHGELVTGGGSADGAAAAGPGAGVATVTGLSPDSSAVAGTSRTAFVSYVVAALVAVFLIAQAVAGSWRLAALVFGSLPVSLAGGVFMVLALGATGELAAAAGLVGVFAVAVRQAIATVARLRSPRPGLDSGPGPDPAPRLAEILTPALVMAVVLAPFVALGGVPGMEMPHTAAAVMLGGLVTTTLVNLFVLPVAGQVFGARLAAGSPVVVSAADAAHPPAAHPPAAHPPAAQPAHAGAGGQSAVVRAQAGDRGAGFRENA
jgi:Cu/Ag efflux pump CusA